MSDQTRRNLLRGLGGLGALGLAGCTSDGGSSGGTTPTSGGTTDSETATGTPGSSSGTTYTVGEGQYQTEVSAADFPNKLYFYAVQSGWMNWPEVMKAFKSKYGVALNDDDRSSGEALKHIRAHANDMDHSGYNGGYTYGIVARNDGFTKAYKPKGWEKIPDSLKTDDHHVHATRRVTTALTYRKDLFEKRGIDEPKTWEDLLNPKITQDLALQTPQAAVGLAAALSINNARGGSMDDVQPVINYYKQLKNGGAEFTDNFLSQFSRGEYGSFIRYDYSGLDLKYNNDAVAEDKVGVTLLGGQDGAKGALNMPYGYALLKGAPNPGAAKLFMDYVLSLEGQKKFLEAYVRPIRADELELPDEFLPQSEYDRTEFQVDYSKLVETQPTIIEDITRGANL